MGLDCFEKFGKVGEVLLIDENPYHRHDGESFECWKLRVTNVHNLISRYKKIIATSSASYKSLVLKHSQKIFFNEFPNSIRMAHQRIIGASSCEEKIVYVVDKHPVYQKNIKKILINKNIQVLMLESDNPMTHEEYAILLSAKVIYWMAEHSAIYAENEIDSEVLSLAGILVNVKNHSNKGTYYGKSALEVLMNIERGKKNQYLNINKHVIEDDNLFFNFLSKNVL